MTKELFNNALNKTTEDKAKETAPAKAQEPVKETVKEDATKPVAEPVKEETKPVVTAAAGNDEKVTEPTPEPEDETSSEDGVKVLDDDTDFVQPDERNFLIGRAKLLGLKTTKSMTTEEIRDLVKANLSTDPQVKEALTPSKDENNVTGEKNLKDAPAKQGRTPTLRQHIQREKMKLVRLRITNMDPKKKDLPGEIITVANEYLGTVRKFVPFGEATDNGYHVPYCIYEVLRDRKFLNIRTRKGKNGTPVVESNYAKEFALEVLPSLTEAELQRLATAQIAAGTINAE